MNSNDPSSDTSTTSTVETTPARRRRSWRGIITIAGLIVLGITPWAQAQLPQPNLPAFCPPLTSIATPSFFDLFFGTTPIRFPFA